MALDNAEQFWQSAARSLARRVNFGWWLARWSAWLMVAAILGAVSILFFRWMPVVDLRWVWGGIGLFLVLGGLAAWWHERRRFESLEASRVRLEDALGMRTRLSAAASGVGGWPQPREMIDWPVQWKWRRPTGIFCFTGVMLLLAAWVPITQKEVAQQRVIEKPSAVKEVEQWVENLRKEEAADEKSLDEVDKKMMDLLKRPAENWYEHGSLEAAGNLKEQTAGMLQELSENLADAERAASALKAAGDSLPQAAKDALAKQLQASSQNLSTGGMKPNEQLLQQLADMMNQQNGGQGLSKEQLEQLSKMMQENSQALQEALKNSPELKLAQCQGGNGGPGEGEGEKEGPGKGGINRGPGEAPLSLKANETNLNSEKKESVQSRLDVQRIAPGDMLTTTDGKHDVDKNAYGTQQGGGIQNSGDGGAAVWQNSLMPSEREALKRYFK